MCDFVKFFAPQGRPN